MQILRRCDVYRGVSERRDVEFSLNPLKPLD